MTRLVSRGEVCPSCGERDGHRDVAVIIVHEAAIGEVPFIPLIYLGCEALRALYPHTQQMVANDMEGGETLAELQNFSSHVRACLQHYGVFVD